MESLRERKTGRGNHEYHAFLSWLRVHTVQEGIEPTVSVTTAGCSNY